jgi:hypothetical protein
MPAWEQQLFAGTMISSLQYQDQQRRNMARQAEYQYRQRFDFYEMGEKLFCLKCGGTKHAVVADNRFRADHSFFTRRFRGWDIVQPFQGEDPHRLSIYCWRCGNHMFLLDSQLYTWQKELVQ